MAGFVLYLWRAETVLRRGLAGDRAHRDVIPNTRAGVRHEHAGADGTMRMLRDHEDLSFAAAEFGTARGTTSVAAIRRHDRSGAPRIVDAGADPSVALARVLYGAIRDAFAIAARALLHVSHLIHGR